jgi:hypothetical protein
MAAGDQGMSFHIRSIAAVVLLGIPLVACGSSGTSSAPGSSAGSEATATPDGGDSQTAEGLCGVVTEAMAVAALGGPVGEPQGGDVVPRPNGIYCHYALAADDRVTVEAQLKEMTREEFDRQATTLLMDQPLDGVGEAAFQRATGILGLPGTSILVFGGGRGVNVTITAEGDAASQLAAAIDIAEAALGS